MNYNYKVTATSLNGDEVIREYFEDREEAEKFLDTILADTKDNMINSLPYDTLRVDFYSFTEGEWAVRSRKLLMK